MGSGTMTWRERVAESAQQCVPGGMQERIALGILLVLALVLRCWGFPHIPYTHDEISALVRVDFPTLGDAISKGVWNIDTHPPGTHALLWCWTHVFGSSEGAVKLPFILMSVAALFLLYRFAHAWAGAGTAVIVTALLATLQYTVMYGQIARPYAMGLFTTALLADNMTRYLGSGRRSCLAGIAIGAVLSAYTHHFALMLAAIMCATGLFLVTVEQRKGFLIVLGIAAACYLPNLPLFFAQLGWKGLDEWLAPPGPDWILKYAWWIGHCSMLLCGALGLLLVLSGAMRIKHRSISRPVWAIVLLWGLLPLIIGYAYSVLRAPVLQYSVVLFSFPYLVIGALAGLRHVKHTYALGIAGALAIFSVLTLVTDRKHYQLFYQSKYEEIVRGTVEAERSGSLAIVHIPTEVLNFYRDRWNIGENAAPAVNLHLRPASTLDSALGSTTAKTVFYGQTSQAQPENIAKVQMRFPFLVERHDRVEGQLFRFAARPVEQPIDDMQGTSTRTPEALEGKGWEVDAKIPVMTDTTASAYGGVRPKRWDFTGHEYGAVYDGPVYELAKGPNDVIEVRADLHSLDPACDMSLVVELKRGDITHFYRATQLADVLRKGTSAVLIAAVKLSDIPGHGEGLRLRTYLYNPGRKRALVSALSLRTRKGDPVLYGLFEPITGRLEFR